MNEIIQGDCLKVMKRMPDKSVDLVVTDPPYGIDYQSNFRQEKYDKMGMDSNLDWLPGWVDEIHRVLKADAHFYCFTRWDVYPKWFAEISRMFTVKNCLVFPQLHPTALGDLKCSFVSAYEMVIFAIKGRREFNKTQERNKRNDKRQKENYKSRFPDLSKIPATVFNLDMKHPTQKSEKVMRLFVELSSSEGELVLDPFVGSGTTCVAAKQLKRDFIGIEIVPKYVEIAQDRLNQKGLEAFA